MKKCFLLYLQKRGEPVQFIKAYTEKEEGKANEDCNLLKTLESEDAEVLLTEIPVYVKSNGRTVKSTKTVSKPLAAKTNLKAIARKPVTAGDDMPEFEN